MQLPDMYTYLYMYLYMQCFLVAVILVLEHQLVFPPSYPPTSPRYNIIHDCTCIFISLEAETALTLACAKLVHDF